MSPSSIHILNREKIQILDAREFVPPSEITVSNNGHLTIHTCKFFGGTKDSTLYLQKYQVHVLVPIFWTWD